MSQNKCGRTVGAAPTATRRDTETKTLVRIALRDLGFASAEADRALGALEHRGWERPVATLVREALGVLS